MLNAGVFEPVLIAARPLLADKASAGPVEDVPAELRERIADGQLASQYTTVVRNGVQVPALVVGAPVTTRSDRYELYLVYLLNGEQRTLDLIRNTLLLGGALLALLLAGIAALVAIQVVKPVRRASAAAKRLANGALDERMAVTGPTELAQLSRSFNGMAAAIKAQIRQLEEFGQLQRRFTSDVSHELRTPLTTVRMAADLLHADRDELPPHLARSTELMVDELDRFEDLLTDLLEISRFDAGMAELSAEAVDLRSTVHTAVGSVGGIAETAGVRIHVLLPDEPVRAKVDSRRIERILRNLLANAVDHAEGKPVEVEMAADESAGRGDRHRSRRRAEAGRGDAGVQPVLARRSVPTAADRWHRPGSRDRPGGRPTARRLAAGDRPTRARRAIPSHPAADPGRGAVHVAAAVGCRRQRRRVVIGGNDRTPGGLGPDQHGPTAR